MLQINVYIPETYLEKIKEALFEAGAGEIGDYSHCCWQTKGDGQFQPKNGANPFLGAINKLEKVVEWKVEMVFATHLKTKVLEALKKSHPYESPAYQIYRLINDDE